MSVRNSYRKSGYVSTSSQRSALIARDTDYWGPPKVPRWRRLGVRLAVCAFVGAWAYVLYVVFS